MLLTSWVYMLSWRVSYKLSKDWVWRRSFIGRRHQQNVRVTLLTFAPPGDVCSSAWRQSQLESLTNMNHVDQSPYCTSMRKICFSCLRNWFLNCLPICLWSFETWIVTALQEESVLSSDDFARNHQYKVSIVIHDQWFHTMICIMRITLLGTMA